MHTVTILQITAVCFFLLGVYVYTLLPKDSNVIDAQAPAQDSAVIVLRENGCTTYQYPYEVGKNLQPLLKTICN